MRYCTHPNMIIVPATKPGRQTFILRNGYKKRKNDLKIHALFN